VNHSVWKKLCYRPPGQAAYNRIGQVGRLVHPNLLRKRQIWQVFPHCEICLYPISPCRDRKGADRLSYLYQQAGKQEKETPIMRLRS